MAHEFDEVGEQKCGGAVPPSTVKTAHQRSAADFERPGGVPGPLRIGLAMFLFFPLGFRLLGQHPTLRHDKRWRRIGIAWAILGGWIVALYSGVLILCLHYFHRRFPDLGIGRLIPQEVARTMERVERGLAGPDGAMKPQWVGVAIFLCFPVGLYLLWRHPTLGRDRKWWGIGGAWSLVVLLMMASGDHGKRTTGAGDTVASEVLVEGDKPNRSTGGVVARQDERELVRPRATVKHDPYTQVVMPAIPSSRVHQVSNGQETPPQAEVEGATQKVRPGPVAVKDVSQVDFSCGPNGEPIELERSVTVSGFVAFERHYYLDRSGRKVGHGPYVSFRKAGVKWNEIIYVHGFEKSIQMWDGEKPLRQETYRGDGDHTRVEYEYWPNGGLKSVGRYRVLHEMTESGESIRSVPHGLCMTFYDNTLVEARGLIEHIAGVHQEEVYEEGRRVSIAIYSRSGELLKSYGK